MSLWSMLMQVESNWCSCSAEQHSGFSQTHSNSVQGWKNFHCTFSSKWPANSDLVPTRSVCIFQGLGRVCHFFKLANLFKRIVSHCCGIWSAFFWISPSQSNSSNSHRPCHGCCVYWILLLLCQSARQTRSFHAIDYILMIELNRWWLEYHV